MDHPLSEAYHKARKQYGLFAGLLIAWELIGFELPGDKPLSSTLPIVVKSSQGSGTEPPEEPSCRCYD